MSTLHVIAALEKRCVENYEAMGNNASCFRGHIKQNNKDYKGKETKRVKKLN